MKSEFPQLSRIHLALSSVAYEDMFNVKCRQLIY